MRQYVQSRCKYKIINEQFYSIEKEFRKKWNSSTGKFVSDAQFKFHVFEELGNKKEFFMLDMVESVVDLILEYMEEIEQYWGYYKEN